MLLLSFCNVSLVRVFGRVTVFLRSGGVALFSSCVCKRLGLTRDGADIDVLIMTMTIMDGADIDVLIMTRTIMDGADIDVLIMTMTISDGADIAVLIMTMPIMDGAEQSA